MPRGSRRERENAPVSAHEHDLGPFGHSHTFADEGVGARQRALGGVVLLTLATMVLELAAGWWSGSLALTADGWHMGTHAFALGGAWVAYELSRRAGKAYAFGGWKIEVLTAYTSGIALLAVAAWIVADAVQRFIAPQPIHYAAALVVAVIGLLVNLASAWLLMRGGQGHSHGERDHDHRHHEHHEHDEHDEHRAHGGASSRAHGAAGDHNYRAALMHVLADALTSVLAIVALAGGAVFGWRWLDAAVALLGAIVIARWSFGVLRDSARALVDATADPALGAHIRSAIECDADARVSDLHVWQVGSAAWCAAVSVVADAPLATAVYRERLAGIQRLRHVTVEVHRCVAGSGKA